MGEATDDLQQLTPEEIEDTRPLETHLRFWHLTKPGESYKKACLKKHGKGSFFSNSRLKDDEPSPTLTSQDIHHAHWAECRHLTFREWKRIGSFPDDYQAKNDKIGKYMIGMSVPPKMTQFVASEIIGQWLKRG